MPEAGGGCRRCSMYCRGDAKLQPTRRSPGWACGHRGAAAGGERWSRGWDGDGDGVPPWVPALCYHRHPHSVAAMSEALLATAP